MDIKTWLSCQSHAATSIFHMGRYCGKWQASTYATGNPSFHVILEGQCWLLLENDRVRTLLSEGDIIFFFTNRPFYLLSSATEAQEELPTKTMLPVTHQHPDDTALLCGFLKPTNYQSALLFSLMPEYLLIERGSRSNQRLHKLFELLKIECWQSESECALTITRLTDLLLVYVVEEILADKMVDVNLLLASKSEKLSNLIMNIIKSPSEKWSVEDMAKFMNMSRSTFIRKAHYICGYTPSELLTRIKVNIAVNLFRRGYAVSDVSQAVGYDSVSGFYCAFKKITGKTPSAFISQLGPLDSS
ncbi:AraC family transcriptional regulator [Yokenella regensburgei]|uniref:AraC family transcriptional regulator n=1 Tax=Yokenella regensburgei TaxID=158877 RepID=UPI0027D93611|nr:cupin domain-containing protein [Yokenella regensburgei]MDQ4429055.1 AraC family transcriptional regulator [Yokenella regensburgei]